MRVTADEASFDGISGDVMARGHVVFDDPKSHLVADEVHYNIRTQKGWFSNGVGYVHPKGKPRPRVLKTENPFYIWGQTVDRLDEDTYLVDNAPHDHLRVREEGLVDFRAASSRHGR